LAVSAVRSDREFQDQAELRRTRKADAQHDKQGKNWPCGAAAKTALRRLVRVITARCAVSGTDLSTWMVRQG
jgi:endonuclease YncB( thermonuclease family)